MTVIALAVALILADHATLPCGQIKDMVAAFGRQSLINGAKQHGYSEKQIQDVIRRCKLDG